MRHIIRSKQRARKSLRASFLDGVFASIQFGLTDQFVTPVALFLGADKVAIGFLSFVRNSLVSVMQVYSAALTIYFGSRKKFLTTSIFLAAVMWLPTYFAPFLFPPFRVPIFVALFTLTSCLNLLATPAWASLVVEYVPPKKRGRYFGFRASVMGLVYFFSLISAGIWLHWFEAISLFWGFALLMGVAALARLVSWYFLTRMYEPKWKPHTEHYFSFWQFISRIRKSNFARFALIAGLFAMSVALVSPFFAVYLLTETGFGYIRYSLIMAGTVLTTYFFQRHWGWFSDRYGNYKVFILCAALISLIPFLWIFSRSFFYLLAIQLLSGFFWAGYNLSSVNFIYDVAMAQKRERCIAYFNAVSGAGMGIGALLGGFLYNHLPALWGSSFITLLIISGLARFVVAHSFMFFTKEVREVYPIHARMLLLDISGVRALGLMGQELMVKIIKVKR